MEAEPGHWDGRGRWSEGDGRDVEGQRTREEGEVSVFSIDFVSVLWRSWGCGH